MEEIYYAFNPWWENRKFDFGLGIIIINRLAQTLHRKVLRIRKALLRLYINWIERRILKF